MGEIVNFPKHNPILRGLYMLLAAFMILFFTWMLVDPTAIYYVSYYQAPVVDFASCVDAGGEVHGSDCYVSETVFFTKGSE